MEIETTEVVKASEEISSGSATTESVPEEINSAAETETENTFTFEEVLALIQSLENETEETTSIDYQTEIVVPIAEVITADTRPIYNLLFVLVLIATYKLLKGGGV